MSIASPRAFRKQWSASSIRGDTRTFRGSRRGARRGGGRRVLGGQPVDAAAYDVCACISSGYHVQLGSRGAESRGPLHAYRQCRRRVHGVYRVIDAHMCPFGSHLRPRRHPWPPTDAVGLRRARPGAGVARRSHNGACRRDGRRSHDDPIGVSDFGGRDAALPALSGLRTADRAGRHRAGLLEGGSLAVCQSYTRVSSSCPKRRRRCERFPWDAMP